MIERVQKLTDQYHAWLRENTYVRELEDWVEITTPFLDRHNDCMQVYVKPSNDECILTDHGYTIEDLELSGFSLESPKRQYLLNTTINGLGVSLEDKALQVNAKFNDFGLQKHNLLQAMIAIDDLYYLASPSTKSFFREEVVGWLADSRIHYKENVRIQGKSGFEHRFDIVIPQSEEYPDRVLLPINSPARETAEGTVFAWNDTRTIWATDTRAYALLNDRGQEEISEKVVNAFHNYEMNPFLWSVREDLVGLLAA